MLEHDIGNTLISWSGDATYFAVSYVNSLKIRKVSIWNDEMDLISCLEPLSGIEQSLAYRYFFFSSAISVILLHFFSELFLAPPFRPSGNLIAVSRVKGIVREIFFFERNGQVRSSFKLPDVNNDYVSWLGWNYDSTIFCIHLATLNCTLREGFFFSIFVFKIIFVVNRCCLQMKNTPIK